MDNKLIDILKEAFSRRETGMSDYDNMLSDEIVHTGEGPMSIKDYYKKFKRKQWEIREMDPQEYINTAIGAFWKQTTSKHRSYAQFYDDMVGIRSENREQIEKLKKVIASEVKMHMPVLDFSNGFTQEGLHRAVAAKELGLKTIPVLYVTRTM